MSNTALYQSSPVAEYAGNPLIEALPPILSEQQAAESIAYFPALPDAERSLPKEVRLHCIDRIKTLVQPLPIHLELESAVSTILRTGYVGRNPMHVSTWRHLQTLSTDRRALSTFNSSASTFSLVGLSGIGKTTALNAVLNLYPQTIVHHRYQNKEFIHTQIVWLRLECPFDGSLSGLCHAFFKAVDKALGQPGRHAARYRSKAAILEMIQSMEQLASTYFIGGLFIDELQHLNSAKTGGKDNMLNFFVNLINSIGIPVVFIGTNSMVNLFADVLRNARRACGLGMHEFKQPKADDATWNLLVEVAWDYQWVQRPSPLTPEIRNTLYKHTQGVTDFLAKLMILGQRYAIQANLESLSVGVFDHIADTKMKLLKPALAALQSGNVAMMRKFEDLMPPDKQLEEMMLLPTSALSIGDLAALRGTKPEPVSPSDAAIVPQKEAAFITTGSAAESGTISISREIACRNDPIVALTEKNWITEDVFEFSEAYRRKVQA